MKSALVFALVLSSGSFASTSAARANEHVVTDRYPNGQIQRRSTFVDGKLDGLTEGWYESGERTYVYHYGRGVSEGIQRQWYKSGAMLTEFNYRDGHEDGQQRMWNSDGTIRSNYVIRNGKRYGLLGAMGCTGKDSTARGM